MAIDSLFIRDITHIAYIFINFEKMEIEMQRERENEKEGLVGDDDNDNG